MESEQGNGRADDGRTTIPSTEQVWVFNHPQDVLTNPQMTRDEKRAMLAAWASDAHAVTDASALRQLVSGAIVKLDDIFDALQALEVLGC